MPQRVSEATADYFEESDVLAKWMEDCCERTDKHREKPIDLYRNWETYCKMIREAPGSPQQFAEQLKKREFRRVKSNGYWFYEGLRIKASELVN
jgi:phage/plasmid-associated DNA primase